MRAKYLIELDMVIAYTSNTDRLSELAISLFKKIQNKELKNCFLASSALLEYSLYLKSKKIQPKEIEDTLIAWRNFPRIKFVDLDLEILIQAFQLQHNYLISFFDSLHAATAMRNSMILISTDTVYSTIDDLNYLEVINIINRD